MAQRLKREKDIVRKSVDSYVKATSQDYSKYMEGGPTYLTYYSYDNAASTQDYDLEDVHSFAGANSPRKYKKIDDVVVYGVDPLAIQSELSNRGLETKISGKFVALPDSLQPTSEDFFSFDVDGLRDHLFRVIEIQYDKPTNNAFYEVQWELYPDDPSLILSNVEDEYVTEYSNIGNKDKTVVKKTSADQADKAKSIVDLMIERFSEDFYDPEIDEFVYRAYEQDGTATDIWCPYLQKFLYNNKILSKYSPKVMDDYFILDVGESENPGIYWDSIYRKSIYRALETQSNCMSFESSFAMIGDYGLKNNRNLPFFMNPRLSYALEFYDGKESFWLRAFHYILADEQSMVYTAGSSYKFVNEADLETKSGLEPGKIIYQVPTKDSMIPVDAYYLQKNDTTIDVVPAGINDMVSSELADEYSDDILFSLARDYILGKDITISDDLLKKINSRDYVRTVHDYLLIPAAIFVLKKTIDAVYEQ
jgi:hypothetical protein